MSVDKLCGNANRTIGPRDDDMTPLCAVGACEALYDETPRIQ